MNGNWDNYNIPLISRTSAALNLCWISSWIAPFFPWYWSGYSCIRIRYIINPIKSAYYYIYYYIAWYIGKFSITLATEHHAVSCMQFSVISIDMHSYSFMCLRSLIWAIAPISLFRIEFYSFNLGCITIAAMQAQSCTRYKKEAFPYYIYADKECHFFTVSIATRYYRNCLQLLYLL